MFPANAPDVPASFPICTVPAEIVRGVLGPVTKLFRVTGREAKLASRAWLCTSPPPFTEVISVPVRAVFQIWPSAMLPE